MAQDTPASDNRQLCPLVSGIMVVADPQRNTIAKVTVNQFFHQTYNRKEVVIVNTSGTAVTTSRHPLVREIMARPEAFPTVGSMRNMGIAEAKGDWLLALDDDDHSHPHRLAFQMAHRVEDCCVLLSHQVRVDISNTVICIPVDPMGHASTALWPRGMYAYPELEPREDVTFIEKFGRNCVVLENGPDWFPGPCLHVALFHGNNVRSREEFLGEFAGPEFYHSQSPNVTGNIVDYVKVALNHYNIRTVPRATPEEEVVGSPVTHDSQ